MAGGHEEAQRAAVGVGDGMELGVHAAFGAADEAAEVPLFTARLDAVRCAYEWVATIYTVLRSALAEDGPSIIRVKTPIR
ncbi:hypothetical protein QU38_02915, partial [Staphylococcus aureus]